MRDGKALLASFHLKPGTHLLLAVSGGVDSMVLLTLLAPLKDTYPLTVAHFNHRLRPDSAVDATLVRRYAKRLAVPVISGHWADPHGGEAAAREARYRFLQEAAHQTRAQVIVLAQHADDQLETILLRLLRSGAVDGMRGMMQDREQGDFRLIRPLLHESKAALRAYARANDVPFREDVTNQDERRPRNFLRHEVIPVLKAAAPQLLAHTGRFTEELQGVEQLAQQQLDLILRQAKQPNGAVSWHDLQQLPPTIQKLLLERLAHQVGVALPQKAIASMLAALVEGRGSKLFALPGGWHLVVSYGSVRIVMPTQGVFSPLTIDQPNRWYQVPTGRLGCFNETPSGAASWAFVSGLPLTVRHRAAGDWLLLSDGRRKLLRRWLIDEKVPRDLRASGLVAAQGQQVVWLENNPKPELFQANQTDIIRPVLVFEPTGEEARSPHE